MRYCMNCGSTVEWRVPEMDSLPRHICPNCNTVHYVNPRVVVGAIVEWGEQILLCRRAIEPRHGFWTLPAGFMENKETTAAAAARETLEEACAHIEVGAMLSLINVPHISQVHIFYHARLIEHAFSAGEESLEVALFHEHEIPWDELAFRTTTLSLERYFADRRHGQLRFHTFDLAAPGPDAPPMTNIPGR